MRIVRSLLVVSTFAVIPPALAQTPPRTRVVEIDVAGASGATASAPLHFALGLPDRGCAGAKVTQSDRTLELQVCRGEGAWVHVEFSEAIHTAKEGTKRQASVEAQLEPGKRVSIGKVTSGGAPVLELFAEMK